MKKYMHELKELLKAYGWIDLGPQRNKWMISFRKDGTMVRLNLYTTTKTVTIQNGNYPCRTYHDINTPLELEGILAEKR